MTQRSFFKRLTSAAAVIALAPQLAFRTPRLTFEHARVLGVEYDATGVPVRIWDEHIYILRRGESVITPSENERLLKFLDGE